MMKNIKTTLLTTICLVASISMTPEVFGLEIQERTLNKVNSLETQPQASSSRYTESKLDVNTATLEQLVMVKGIGPSKAAAILKYRKQIGGFKTIEELVGVRGIGDKALKKLRLSLHVVEDDS
jgi:comEA protein